MKFELTSDEAVLALSGAAAGVYAAQMGMAPRQAYNNFFEPGMPYSETANRYTGMSAKKNALKAAGCTWLVAGAMDGYYASTGKMRMETNVATAVANAALGCLCLWRGFSKDSGVSTVATTTTAGKGKWVGATDALLVG